MKPCPKAVGSIVSSANRGDRCGASGSGRTVRILSRHRATVSHFVAAIVVPRRHAGQQRDGGFEAPEESDRVERPVAPSRGDAVVTVVRSRVMRGVFCAAEEHTARLQRTNGRGWRRHVRPLMNLVGQRAQAAEGKAEHYYGPTPRAIDRQRQEQQQDGGGDGSDFAVGVDNRRRRKSSGLMWCTRNGTSSRGPMTG